MNTSQRDYVRLPDGSVLVERRACECGESLTLYRGVWWEDSDTPHDCDTDEQVKSEKCCANIHDPCTCTENCECTCSSCECWEAAE